MQRLTRHESVITMTNRRYRRYRVKSTVDALQLCKIHTKVRPARNVRRILVRGVNAPLPPEAKKILKTWLRNGAFWSIGLSEYIYEIAPFYTPACSDCSQNITSTEKTALFCMCSLFNFSSIFPGGGAADPICPYVRTPMRPAAVQCML